jgi:hypothetical protein
MSFEVLRYDPDIKRLRTFIDYTDDIQYYTRNNVYPQICEGIRDRSYTVKSACDRMAKFLRGEGFSDKATADLVVNSKGQTLNQILRFLTTDAATYSGGWVAHLGVNMMGEYNNLSIWPLMYWRFGLPDENGDVHDYKYNSNWEQDPYKEVSNIKRILTYPKFNPDKDVILAQMEEWGDTYPGQVFYVSPLEDQYPLATFDSVLDQAQTQEEIGIFRLASIQNGLNAGSIFSYPGKFEDDTKASQFKESLNEYKGGKGANSIIVIEDETGQRKAADLVTPLTMTDADKIHEFISRDDKEAIMEAFAMPKEILGVLPTAGMFNQENIKEAYTYYNSITRDYRKDISMSLKKIFANWETPIQSDFAITELQYGATASTSVSMAQPASPATPQAETNSILTNMTGRQMQGIQRIVRQFNKDQITKDQAAGLLKKGFGFTDQDVEDWLVTKEEEAPIG